MLDCPICASGDIEHKGSHPLTMTSDEAQDWLLAQHNAAPGPPDPARFGAAIRAIRAKAIADYKSWTEPGAGHGEGRPVTDEVLREAAQRLCDAIAHEAAVKGLARDGFPQGWKAEMDAESATLCALQDTRTALDGRERPHQHAAVPS